MHIAYKNAVSDFLCFSTTNIKIYNMWWVSGLNSQGSVINPPDQVFVRHCILEVMSIAS